MRAAPELPWPTARRVVDADRADALVAELLLEIGRLEQDLADTDAAAAAAERRASSFPTAVDADAAPVEGIERFLDDLLAAARAEVRQTVEETELRVAAARLLQAHTEANEVLRAARADAGATRLTATPVTFQLPTGERVPARPHQPAPAPPPPPPSAPPAAQLPSSDDPTFDAFWREQDHAAEARTSALAPLEALAPMVVLLVMLVLLLRFI